MDRFYAASVFLSAFLLFQIQPLIGKYILPWFGGTPTVWSSVLLFFQALLTGGYAYAYWLLGRKNHRLQSIVHLSLLVLSLVLLFLAAFAWRSPLTPDASWRPQGNALSIFDIFKILAVAVGGPYFLLASNSTLMQAWANRENHPSPYRLYALSNAGSLLALITYPFIFEPTLTLRTQANLWSLGYLIFALGTLFITLKMRQPIATASTSATSDNATRPSIATHFLWIALAACASTLLIAVTSQITQEVAVVPFLWVLPLTIYLLTFILAFAGDNWYIRRVYLVAYFVFSALSVWMLVKYPPLDTLVQLVIYSLLLFICCMICHNELYQLRPHPRFLPSFYLMVAIGGAVGGIFVNMIAPLIFATGFWELQWAMLACGVLVTIIMHRERTPLPSRAVRKARQREGPQRTALKPIVIASAIGVLLLSGSIVLVMWAVSSDTLLAARNFFGVSRVWEINDDQPKLRAYQLTHGKTVHGFQFQDRNLRRLPTTYYADTSGIGLVLLNRTEKLRVGALGLGVGVIAAYGEPGDVFRFYEIDPQVIRIAQGADDYFTFLKDSRAEIQIVPGDARVSLERELANGNAQNFDVLVLDAFSGDTVPLHLLTQEAFAIYLKHLKPNGIIAINASNRYFNLPHEIYRLADAFSLNTMRIEDRGDGVQSYDSIWMLLSRERIQTPEIASRTAPRPPVPANLSAWTDDFSNLLQIRK